MADGRSLTSAKNGKNGGRPVSEATLKAMAARLYIAQEVEKSLTPMVAKAINDAVLGNHEARKWLSEYAWGKPAINLGTDESGKPFLIGLATDDEEEEPKAEAQPAPVDKTEKKPKKTPVKKDTGRVVMDEPEDEELDDEELDDE